MERDKGVGYCGLVCALCGENKNCVGCKKGGCPQKDSCKNYLCCQKKGYNTCYECENYPCDDSILIKPRIKMFCDIINEYSEEEVLLALKENEKKGVQYHYQGSHIGDYDKARNHDEMINLIFHNQTKKD